MGSGYIFYILKEVKIGKAVYEEDFEILFIIFIF